MRKPYYFYDEIYMVNFYFCPGYTSEELREAIVQNVGVDPKDDTVDLTNPSGRCICVRNTDDGRYGIFIWTREATFHPKTYRTLAHEAFHALNEVFSNKNITLEPMNDEPWAYYMGFIMWNLSAALADLNGVPYEE